MALALSGHKTRSVQGFRNKVIVFFFYLTMPAGTYPAHGMLGWCEYYHLRGGMKESVTEIQNAMRVRLGLLFLGKTKPLLNFTVRMAVRAG